MNNKYMLKVAIKKLNEVVRSINQILETLNDENDKKNNIVEIGLLKQGDIFETDKRKYVVLEQVEGIGFKIMSLDVVLKDENFDDDGNDYKNSQLREKCDTDILEDYESEFGAENLVEHKVDLTTVDNQKCFGTVRCKVRPLTFDEARQYNGILVRPELPDWYWTCTAWSTADRGWPRTITVVCPSGYFCRHSCYNSSGVRPVCILKSNVLVSKVESDK